MNEISELRRTDPVDRAGLTGVVQAGRAALLETIRAETDAGPGVGDDCVTGDVPTPFAEPVHPAVRRRLVGMAGVVAAAAATVSLLAGPVLLSSDRGSQDDVDVDVVEQPGVELPAPDDPRVVADHGSSEPDDELFEPAPVVSAPSERAVERSPGHESEPPGDSDLTDRPDAIGSSADAALTRDSVATPTSGPTATTAVSAGEDVPPAPVPATSPPAGPIPGEGASSSGETPLPDDPGTTVTPSTAPPSTSVAPESNTADQPVDPDRDLLVVTLDFAHTDDAHAAVAAREVATDVGVAFDIVVGTPSLDSTAPVRPYEDVMNAAWGQRWIDASIDRPTVVAEAAQRWITTIDSGGVVRVAEGGVSDFTAEVVREIRSQRSDLDTTRSILVVHHSSRNENATRSGDLAELRSIVHYVRIDDGNSPNETADLAQTSGSFESAARAGQHADAWAEAFDGRPAADLDFSDAVTVLHIVGVGLDRVAGVDDFAAEFVS